MPAKSTSSGNKSDDKILFIVAYIIPLLTGILVLILNKDKDKRLRLHSFQAIFLGIVFVILWVLFSVLFFIPFLGVIGSLIWFLLWLYGLYVGFEGYNGRDIVIPVITDYAKRYSK